MRDLGKPLAPTFGPGGKKKKKKNCQGKSSCGMGGYKKEPTLGKKIASGAMPIAVGVAGYLISKAINKKIN